MPRLQIRRIAYALGAQVTGIDLREPLDDAAIAVLRQAWLDHLLLWFPQQALDAGRLTAFARQFGDLEEQGLSKHSDTPHVSVLSNRPSGKPGAIYKNGPEWHSDKSFTTQPTAATFIACKEIPEVGGDTIFANMYAAYESLSPAMQTLASGLSAIHDVPLRRQPVNGSAAAVQPVVRVHPETNRKALFLGYRARQIAGMTEEESRPILAFLNRHAVREEFTYRHHWTTNDLLMWDNRCMLHIALRDYDLERDVREVYLSATVGSASGLHATGQAAAAGLQSQGAG